MKRIFYALITLSVLALACNFSSAAPPAPNQQDLELALTATSLALTLQPPVNPPTQTTQPPADTPNPTETTQPSATTCFPTVTATLDVNVRTGPDPVFERVGFLRVGESAKVAGRNSSGNWWYIEFSKATGGFAWVWADAVTPSCIPGDLQVVASPPTPTPSTPKSDIKITDIYVDAAWKVFLKIVNDGPSDLKDAKANLDCGVVFTPILGLPIGAAAIKPLTFTLEAGNEKVIDPGLGAVSPGGSSEITCTISPVDYEDPNSGNNSRTQTFNRPV